MSESTANNAVGGMGEGGQTATTGKVYEMVRTNTLNPLIAENTLSPLLNGILTTSVLPSALQSQINGCVHPSPGRRQYAVVTTIAGTPTDAMMQLAETMQWCVIIVGDTKSPASFGDIIQTHQQSSNVSVAAMYRQLIYVDMDMQATLPYKLIAVTPEASFSRKNIGFLLAISQQPSVIYDFDDDNVMMADSLPPVMRQLTAGGPPVMYTQQNFIQQPAHHIISLHSLSSSAQHTPVLHTYNADILLYHDAATNTDNYYNLFATSVMNDITQVRTVNPYPQLGLHDAWPRGYPLEAVHQSITAQQSTTAYPISYRSCLPVVQQLGQGRDPDVDGVYRLVRGVPADFRPFQQTADAYVDDAAQTDATHRTLPWPVFATPSGVFTPYNAQCTMHLPSAYYSMLLPKTVHGRVADIWRSYIVQTLLTYTDNECVVFTPPHVDHLRNAHDYTRDFNSELPLYQQTSALLHMLSRRCLGQPEDIEEHIHSSLQAYTAHLPPAYIRIIQLYIDLYEYGVLGLDDVVYIMTWCVDLVQMHSNSNSANAIDTASQHMTTSQPVESSRQNKRAVCIMFNYDAPPDQLWPILQAQRRLHQHITIIADQLLSATYALPYGVHAIQCNSQRGYRQHICEARCMDYYANTSLGFHQYNSPAAEKLQGVVFVSDDTYVDYAQLMSAQYPPSQTWVSVIAAEHATSDVSLSTVSIAGIQSLPDVRYGQKWYWWLAPELGGEHGAQLMMNRLAEHPVYNQTLTTLFGGPSKFNIPAMADNMYLPLCCARELATVVQWLTTSVNGIAARSFCEMVVLTIVNVALHVGCNADTGVSKTIISPNTTYLWEDRTLPTTELLVQNGIAILHPVKVSDAAFKQLYLHGFDQVWKALGQH